MSLYAVGDKVIIGAVSRDWPQYVEQLLVQEGHVGEILSVTRNEDDTYWYYHVASNESLWNYSEESLSLVADHEFKVGDLVRITGQNGFHDFVQGMGAHIGRECTISSMHLDRIPRVRFHDSPYTWGFECIELIKAQIGTESEAGTEVIDTDEIPTVPPTIAPEHVQWIRTSVRASLPDCLTGLESFESPKDSDWRERELERFGSIYTHLPDTVLEKIAEYNFIPIKDHFVHVGLHDKSKIGYTESLKKGEADRQSTSKIGKYLRKYSEMKDHEIAEVAALYRKEFFGDLELKFARTREEIRHVYRNGPDSCMSHSCSSYNTSGIHPVEVYATPDVSVAYIERDGRITARTVCNEIEKSFCEIYGDAVIFDDILRDHGYDNGDLSGCNLLVLYNDNMDIICPYLDGERSIRVETDFLVVDSDGEETAERTNGLLRVEGAYCPSCEETVSTDSVHWFDDDSCICHDCLSEHYTNCYTSEYSTEYISNDEEMFEYNCSWYTEDGLEAHELICIGSTVYQKSDCLWSERDQEMYTPDCTVYSYYDANDDEDITGSDHEIITTIDTDRRKLQEDCYEYDGNFYEDKEHMLQDREREEDAA